MSRIKIKSGSDPRKRSRKPLNVTMSFTFDEKKLKVLGWAFGEHPPTPKAVTDWIRLSVADRYAALEDAVKELDDRG